MGGLYISEEPLDSLYCEQCGDSDIEIGYFKDDDIEGVWEVIKPSDLCCIDCKEKNICEGDCEKIPEDPGFFNNYTLLYCMKFFEENMSYKKGRYVYLLCVDKDTGNVFVKVKHGGHELLKSFCFKEELENKTAISLIPFSFDIVDYPKKIKIIKVKNKRISVYKCVVKKEEEEFKEGTISYMCDGWYGFIPVNELKDVSGLDINWSDLLK